MVAKGVVARGKAKAALKMPVAARTMVAAGEKLAAMVTLETQVAAMAMEAVRMVHTAVAQAEAAWAAAQPAQPPLPSPSRAAFLLAQAPRCR